MLTTYDNWYDIPGNAIVTITVSATGEIVATNRRGHACVSQFFDFDHKGRIRDGFTARA